MNKILTSSLVSFIRRKWLLVVLTAASIVAAGRDDLFQLFGSWLYLFPLGLGAALVMFLIRDVAFTVLRAYADPRDGNKDFAADWEELSPEGRVFALILANVGLFIGVCIIAAALWK